jgi:ArsR family transcriptional regulator
VKPIPASEIREVFADNGSMCSEVIKNLELVSNPVRLRTVCMLMHGEYCVADIVNAAGEGSATNVSQQLRMLRLAGVVETRRSGKQVFYRLKDGPVPRLVMFLRNEYMNKLQEQAGERRSPLKLTSTR